MSLVPLQCPGCHHRAQLAPSMVEVKVVAGTEAHPTCRWRCPGCSLSVVLCLTKPEWTVLSKMPVRIVNVSRPSNDQDEAKAWGELTEDQALDIMRELHDLPTVDPAVVRSSHATRRPGT